MLRLKAERRSLRKVSGASASESLTKTPDVAHFTTGAPVSSVTPNFWRGVRFAFAFDLFLVAFVLSAAYLVGWMAFHVPTAVVILGGLVLVGLVVVRGASS